MKIDIEVNRYSKLYKQGDVVVGEVTVSSTGDEKHDGVYIEINGSALLSKSPSKVSDNRLGF